MGPNSRYKITRKLGSGMHSSTWLVRDTTYVCTLLGDMCLMISTERVGGLH